MFIFKDMFYIITILKLGIPFKLSGIDKIFFILKKNSLCEHNKKLASKC